MTPSRLAVFVLIATATIAGAAELSVGPGKRFTKPSQAAASAHNGDTVNIDAGVYEGDVCVWTQKDLLIRSVGGLAHMKSGGKVANGKAIWVVAGVNITVEGIEFSGASCRDGNGAGIRIEGTAPTVRGCYFHDNQNGILTANDPLNDVLIERCEFASNGAGEGQTHNLYINHIRSLTFRWNYSHHAKVGHNIKTRALANHIIGNRFMDEATGTSSYVVDIPNGGLTFLLGNIIQQGPASSNRSVMINYGEEPNGRNPIQRLYVINNTCVNDHPQAGVFLNIAAGTTVARVENNLFIGPGTPINGPATSKLRNLCASPSQLVNRAAYDYRLVPGASAIDAGIDPGTADGQALLPIGQYVHPKDMETRMVVGAAPDIGAYEFGVTAKAKKKKGGEAAQVAVDKPPEPKAEPKPPPQLADAKQKEVWIARLRGAVERELAARREPQFEVASLHAQATLRELHADGVMVVALAGTGEMTVAWATLTDRDRASLAIGMARRNDPQLNALAAFFLLAIGQESTARDHLMRAGEQAAAVEAAFVPSAK